MNIEKWLYPKPRLNWSLNQHPGEIIWIPVYEQPTQYQKPSGQIMNLRTMTYKPYEEPYRGHPESAKGSHDIRRSQLVQGDMSTHSNQSYNTQKERINEINEVYKTSLGIEGSFPGSLVKHQQGFVQNSVLMGSVYSPQKAHLLPVGAPLGYIPSYPQYPVSIPADQASPSKSGKVQYKIPCLFLRQNQFQNKILLYFHSNAEDIHSCAPFCRHLMVQLNVCVLAMEYPGYSYYSSHETSEELINENAERVFDFLTDELGIDHGDIYVLGRSIGCTPAIDLVTRRNAGMLVLVSPFLSVERLLKDHYGLIGSLGYMVIKNGYDNESKVQDICSPTLIIHGKRDELISSQHSISIFERLAGKAELVLPDDMTHSLIDPFVHITDPIVRFMDKAFRSENPDKGSTILIPGRYFQQ